MTIDEKLITNRLMMLALFCYPAVLLTVRSGMNALFFLILLLSLFYLFRTPGSWGKDQWDRYTIAYALAMASPVLAVFISQVYHGSFSAPPYDGPSRYFLAVPILLALRQLPLRTLNILQYAFPIGVLAAFFMIMMHPYNWGEHKLTTAQFINLIHFSDSVLMIGVLSLFCLSWQQRDTPLSQLLKLAGLLAGIYMSVQTGERGAWVAFPILMLIWFTSHQFKKPWLMLSLATLAVVIASISSYALIDVVHKRIDLLGHDLTAYYQGNRDTSIGIRLQLWGAALHLFLEHPIFGVGPGGFVEMMSPLSESGVITAKAAELGRGEVHNEILAKAAGLGIVGVASILAIHLVPFIAFFHARLSPQPETKTAAYMGLAMVTGFFIFGLTVEIFNLKMTAAFYSLTIAVLLAAATSQTERQDRHV